MLQTDSNDRLQKILSFLPSNDTGLYSALSLSDGKIIIFWYLTFESVSSIYGKHLASGGYLGSVKGNMTQNFRTSFFYFWCMVHCQRVIPVSLKELRPSKDCEMALILPLLQPPAAQNKRHMYLSWSWRHHVIWVRGTWGWTTWRHP